MAAYYNEIDPKAAAWLRELINAGHIADGDVDERSIEDVVPTDLSAYTQCHFFAGIGVWSYALRNAGWSDERPVWTGSCPCQPFSAAGKKGGTSDERHLWPAFQYLIRECRPVAVFGEQVANKAGESWFDLVSADLEAEGYATGLSVFPACSVGAPHLRKRLYWCAERLGDSGSIRWEPGADQGRADRLPASRQERCEVRNKLGDGSTVCELAHTSSSGLEGCQHDTAQQARWRRSEKGLSRADGAISQHAPPSQTNGFWRAADWLFCRDGKWRPVEPSAFPLAHGSPARVGRLRGYGNAIVAPQAQAFIEAYMSI